MNLTIPPNKIYATQQQISSPSSLITLIGENGCGKSAILEKVFEDYLQDINRKVICFASGQNESFSSIYSRFVRDRRRVLIQNSFNRGINTLIRSFYFDTSWARLLIFFATSIRRGGLVQTFLYERNYIDFDENGIDSTTSLTFSLRVTGAYAKNITSILRTESRNPLYNSIRKTIPHQMLEKLIDSGIRANYNFEQAIPKALYKMKAQHVVGVFDTDIDQIFTFLWVATHNGEFINRSDCKLNFQGDIELNDLSDGEYMLLSFYALLDLFDNPDTLFLLDEIDSHLYFKNIIKLWNALQNTRGSIITTTHSADSIIQNDINQIYLVENGMLSQKSTADTIMHRLSALTSGETYKFRIAAKVKYLALVENYFDWFIFIELCKRKIPNCDVTKLEKIHYIKCSSGYNQTTQQFGLEKKLWVEDLLKVIKPNELKTERIFMICDRDNLPLPDISQNDGVSVVGRLYSRIPLGRNNLNQAFLLSWKRREIENYLLSYTLLAQKGKLYEINQRFAGIHQLQEHLPCDNEDTRSRDLKAMLQPLYLRDDVLAIGTHEEGVDYVKLQQLIDLIPPSEISEDIEKMYHFIISKIN